MTVPRNVGLWIDHRKAVVVTIADGTETTAVVRSDAEDPPKRTGGARAASPYESRTAVADDSRERRMKGRLGLYYSRVLAQVGDAASVVIFGPGEAKGELAKQIAKDRPGSTMVQDVQTVGRLTMPQIAARVRAHFSEQAAAPTKPARRTRRTHA